jgi:transcriptional regulator with XRE-family HTH domain
VSKSTHYRDENAIKAFGQKVRELRQQKGMSIEEFANTVGIHVTQLSRLERGETNVTISYIMLLAKELGVQPGLLLEMRN